LPALRELPAACPPLSKGTVSDMNGTVVLVVEDEFGSAELLKFVLEHNGFEVRLAADGDEALECLAREVPALVLTDVMMPLMNGIELCQRMRAHPSYRSIPIVLMSAAHEMIESDCKASAFLTKPLDVDLLLETVNRLVRRTVEGSRDLPR
jgi:CheY-like chemotaxis protein